MKTKRLLKERFPREWRKLLKKCEGYKCMFCGETMQVDEGEEWEDRWREAGERRIVKSIGVGIYCPKCYIAHIITVDVWRYKKR